MIQGSKRMIAALALAALATGMAAPAWAAADGTAPASVTAGWQGHWAKPDLDALRASNNIEPEVFVSGMVNPDDAMPVRLVADVLTCMYGAGGEQGDALDRAVKLGLIRTSDFAGNPIRPDQSVSRELFALLLSRALGVNGAEDPAASQAVPGFSDAAEIQAPYRAAVALMRAEGLLIGDGAGRFWPAQPVTYAQAARTIVKVSAWTRERTVKLAGLDPAAATYLLNGQKVKLSDGRAEHPAAPGSAAKAVTRLSDRLVVGDLTGDGKIDLAAVLTYDGGGSGTFFYLAAVQADGTPVAAVFLGDRIAVQNVRIVSGRVAVDLLTRAAGDPMVVRPHIKETRMFEVRDSALVPSGE